VVPAQARSCSHTEAVSSSFKPNLEEVASSRASTTRQVLPNPSNCINILSSVIGRHHPPVVKPPVQIKVAGNRFLILLSYLLMKNNITIEYLKNDFRNLGLKTGDTVFIAADLLRVGYFNVNRENTYKDWINLLCEVVGDEGTLVIPAYTSTFPKWKKNRQILFTRDSPTTSGALSLAFQNDSRCIRSKHPTNSCFAIGKNARHVLEGHDAASTSYRPYGKVIELGGKNLMIGAFEEKKLAPMAMHYAQETLGVTRKHWSTGLYQTYYVDSDHKTKLFTRNDVGGCTAGGFKSYGHHVLHQAINFGKVGKSVAAYIDCAKSFKIFQEIIKNSPQLIKCDDAFCPYCYGSPIHKHPIFWVKKLYRFLRKSKSLRKS
jgi:aminoglycoside 3-N-acetyltransferase